MDGFKHANFPDVRLTMKNTERGLVVYLSGGTTADRRAAAEQVKSVMAADRALWQEAEVEILGSLN